MSAVGNIVDFVSKGDREMRALEAERLEKRKAALGYVLTTSRELLTAMHAAGIGTESLQISLRALRRTASLRLQFAEEEGHDNA